MPACKHAMLADHWYRIDDDFFINHNDKFYCYSLDTSDFTYHHNFNYWKLRKNLMKEFRQDRAQYIRSDCELHRQLSDLIKAKFPEAGCFVQRATPGHLQLNMWSELDGYI